MLMDFYHYLLVPGEECQGQKGSSYIGKVLTAGRRQAVARGL